MNVHHREEVLNVLLATLLDKRGVIAAPELILRSGPQSARAMPDVLVHFRGLRTAIEGRTITTKAAQNTLLKNTRARIQQGIAHLGIAIVYPPSLSRIPFEQLEEVFSHVTLRFAVISEIEDLQLPLHLVDMPAPGDATMPAQWVEGNIDNLTDLLRRTYEKLVQEDIVKHAAELIQTGILQFSHVILQSPGSIQRSAEALGIRSGATVGSEESPEGES